jgi:hypothetical protein
MKTLHGFAAAAVILAASLPGFAQLNLVNTRAAFPTTDSVNWSLLGPAFTTVSSPFTIATTGGSTVSVSHAPGTLFERRNQTTGGWFGNFSVGNALLWNRGDNGAVTFDPANLISGAGFNVQSNVHGAFTLKLEAFDAAEGLIGSVIKNGVSDLNVGTAIFIGFMSDSLNVDKFVATLVSAAAGPSDFAINTMALSGTVQSLNVAVPEPSVYGLVGVFAILALVGRERLRRHTEA